MAILRINCNLRETDFVQTGSGLGVSALGLSASVIRKNGSVTGKNGSVMGKNGSITGGNSSKSGFNSKRRFFTRKESSRFFALAWFALLLICLSTSAHAQNISAEYRLKAVYLYNFVQYVEWPPEAFADPESPLVIGVLGDDPFGSFLDETVRGEVVKNRPLVVRRFKRVRDVHDCHILFVSTSEKDKLQSTLATLRGRSILTVSDIESFAFEGGVVRFMTEKNKIRFRINIDAMKEAHLSISSKLLQLADIISSENRK